MVVLAIGSSSHVKHGFLSNKTQATWYVWLGFTSAKGARSSDLLLDWGEFLHHNTTGVHGTVIPLYLENGEHLPGCSETVTCEFVSTVIVTTRTNPQVT